MPWFKTLNQQFVCLYFKIFTEVSAFYMLFQDVSLCSIYFFIMLIEVHINKF